MKHILLLFIFLSYSSCKTDEPKTRYSQKVVQDHTRFFSEIENSLLTKKIIEYEKTTTNQICIYTIDSIPNNEDPLYHATNIGDNLGVGTKEKNNGLLILVSRFDRKIAIATGIGTEKILTDSICKMIIDKTIVPHLKEDNYYQGINSGLDSLIRNWK